MELLLGNVYHTNKIISYWLLNLWDIMYCKGLGAFIHYVIMHHILYTRTDTGVCSTITEGKTQEAKSFTWNP